ncbi:RagB/SusD family nutrient uptake outer membrane protein [Flavivirga sp. 57AJ16]|uniref:RagB/SusD family nutrient uptake outer membrane protein n=1 Tax=Flavivirga sp. 57AJ16 TaxID=3025307 RepID=UPI002366BE16|nr:RagB/SusD family nutrient uptake outer membrane protein [Flavivirga sp. 57AJ16]MDD7884559.1 RagB/SusD family nutrient uptake outer membrane protein [Flavivirga sp. 57AJ16]
MKKINKYIKSVILVLFIGFSLISCEDLIEIDIPNNQLVTASVFQDTATVNSAVLGMYAKVANPDGTQGGLGTIAAMFNGMSADEIHHFYTFLYGEFVTNTIETNSVYVAGYWSFLYRDIYTANAIIEGLNKSSLSKSYVDPILGEAKFIRALCYFYLINEFGPVPLVLQTDPTVTATQPRESVNLIYEQIKTDLLDAIEVLPDNYGAYEGKKTRATTWAAKALLARVYLYNADWENAEIEATQVINKTALFDLEPDLEKVFLANSQEGILQFPPAFSSSIWMASTFYPSFSANFVLNEELTNDFEAGDKRRDSWTINYSSQGVIYPHSAKYKRTFSNPSAVEYNQVLRISEQYLIRAEARTQQGKFDEARADINKIRERADLDDLTIPNTKEALMVAIEQERRVELFCEWGHRWFDLKRWSARNNPSQTRAEEVLSVLKVDNWQSTDLLFPIPETSIVNNPNLSQNPGYN